MLLTIIALLFVAGAIVTFSAVRNAPEAIEDDTGFHVVSTAAEVDASNHRAQPSLPNALASR